VVLQEIGRKLPGMRTATQFKSGLWFQLLFGSWLLL